MAIVEKPIDVVAPNEKLQVTQQHAMETTMQNKYPNTSTSFQFSFANVTDDVVQNNIDIVGMVQQLEQNSPILELVLSLVVQPLEPRNFVSSRIYDATIISSPFGVGS